MRVLRLATGTEEEEGDDAAAGALLDAETALKIDGMHAMIESYIEALNNSKG